MKNYLLLKKELKDIDEHLQLSTDPNTRGNHIKHQMMVGFTTQYLEMEKIGKNNHQSKKKKSHTADSLKLNSNLRISIKLFHQDKNHWRIRHNGIVPGLNKELQDQLQLQIGQNRVNLTMMLSTLQNY